MVRTSLENCEEGVKVGGQLVKAVRFADDQAMVADSEKGLQEIMDSLNAVVEDFGMSRHKENEAKDAFNSRRELLTKKFNLRLKKRMIKTLVWSVLLYGSESWTLKKEDIRRLESADIAKEGVAISSFLRALRICRPEFLEEEM
ncbi:uncharacterized protein LOC125028694 [Penaeus chinensis]|uniref:uncharacterized protein LOC125028694 n=1 Tax=Penaeus chinensis TaxID=139456 RepID=UPI001FB8325A|nr:uncharacterized protein LOC125028694 [Penaeus chinensis]